MTDTNSTENKPESLVNQLDAQWRKAGSKVPSATEGKKLMAAYTTAAKALEQAEAAYIAAQKAVSKTVADIVLARGKGRIKTPSGLSLTPMSRGETMYFRDDTPKDVDTFG